MTTGCPGLYRDEKTILLTLVHFCMIYLVVVVVVVVVVIGSVVTLIEFYNVQRTKVREHATENSSNACYTLYTGILLEKVRGL